MTKFRFLTILALVPLLFWATAFASGLPIALFIDLPSFLLAVVLPFLILSVIHPWSRQRAFLREIFRREGPGDRKLLQGALAWAESFKRVVIYGAATWTIVGAIGIGTHLEAPDEVGANAAVMLLVPLYAALLLLTVAEPLRAGAAAKLQD